MAAVDGATKSVFSDCIWGAWARSAVANWECQCDSEEWGDCEVFWGEDVILLLCTCAPFMLSKG